MPANNDEIMAAIQQIRQEAKEEREAIKPILENAKMLFYAHGTPEMTQARINFVHVWMERERDRADLRRAIIKHTTILAITAVVIFATRSVWVEFITIVRTAVGK
jgi:hypothetical protein